MTAEVSTLIVIPVRHQKTTIWQTISLKNSECHFPYISMGKEIPFLVTSHDFFHQNLGSSFRVEQHIANFDVISTATSYHPEHIICNTPYNLNRHHFHFPRNSLMIFPI